MVKHDSAALLLLRFFLPAALLFATCFVFTIPTLPYFIAFLAQHFRPRYEVTKRNFPSVYLLLLAVYSALLVIAHIVLAALVAKRVVIHSTFASLAHALAIPDYKASPWLSVKLLLAPIVVLIFSCFALRSSTPDGEERFLTFRKRKRTNSSDDDDNGTDSSRASHALLDGVKDTTPSSFDDTDSSRVEQVVVTKFTRHMAGRGGIFWTTIACGFTGLSYSSLLTLIFLAVFAFVIVVWAFRISRLYPLRLQGACVACVKSFRIFVMLYLVFIVALQNKWFITFNRSTEPSAQSFQEVFRLIGFVPLDTSREEGWAFVTAFCAALAVYVFSGIFIYSLMDLMEDQRSKHILDEEEMGSIHAQPVGYKLSYYETQFLYSVLHLSSLGLLIWSLVFPGLLTLPMLSSALAYFASSSVRSARFFDRIIVYAILLQIAHFLFVAITTAFDIDPKSPVIWLLGLRSFKPQFTMNLVQALALGLFCTNIFCKRYIRHQNRGSSRSGSKKEPLGFQDFFRNAEFSATAKKQRALYTVMKVVLDQIALSCLYLSGGASASALNAFFIVSLGVLCFCQAFGVTRRQKVMLFLWTIVLTYSTAFLVITCTVCRAISEFRPPKCTMKAIGVLPATSLQVVAYTATLVFSAIQVHFTWSASQSDSENQAGSLEDFKSRFWRTTRKYFLFLAYIALLAYPLIYPANFLSYGYVLFLAISILVELLGPLIRARSPSVRPLIRAYWPTVVLFSACALFSRYFNRFDFLKSDFARKWVFGMGRGITDFQFTSGDASILIIVSLQGRLFGIDALLKGIHRDQHEEDEEDVPKDSNTPLDVLGLRSSSVGLSRLSAGLEVPSVPSEQDRGFNRGTLSDPDAIPSLEFPAPSFGVDSHQSRGIPDSGIDSKTRNLDDRASIAMRAFPTGRLGATRDDTSSVQRVAVADRERLNQFAEVIKNWRMSLPVKQTEKLLHNAYDYTVAIVRSVLLRYSYVLEACAILAAAVWLPGFSLFGAVYSIMGCVLLLAEQAFVDVRGNGRSQPIKHIPRYRMTKILPIVLAILSFALMSGQYVYSIIAEIHQTAPGYILEYVGFQKSARVPIDQKAMLAHVLVFVTAFLQRVAVTWAAKDAEKISEEERQASILPGPAQSQDELGDAIQIGKVLSGVGGIHALPPHRAPMSPFELVQDIETKPGKVLNAEPVGPQEFSAVRSLGLQQAPSMSSEVPNLNVGDSDLSSNPMSHLDGFGVQSDATSDSSELEYGGRKDLVSHGFAGRVIDTAKGWISEAYRLAWEVASLLAPFWQKYGFDVTFMYLVIGGAFTRTSFSVIYIALVMAVSGLQRKKIQRHWHHITLLLASLVLLQYFLTLGIPRPMTSVTENCSSQKCWRVWLYIDAGNQSLERKWDVTFAFLAVICASITLNAVSPGARGFSYWFKKALPSSIEDPSQSESSTGKAQTDENFRVNEDIAASETQMHSTTGGSNTGGFQFFSGLQRKSTGKYPWSIAVPSASHPEVLDISTSKHTSGAEGGLSHLLFKRTSSDEDFTQRPISSKNFIKLSWMRFAGSLVQLYMFAASVVETSIFSGVLLLLSFYFMFQFTNVHLKKSKFFIVRFYVLSLVFILVAYQAPFIRFGSWAKTLGMYKTIDVPNRTGLTFLYLMVSVWLICQMQSRIYESNSFQYVVKYGDEDANVRFKRAVHEHNMRKYEHMLGRNKNHRARQAREGRLERLKKLKSSSRSVDALYKVCVEDEIEVLRSKVKANESKGHKFSSHVKSEVKEKKEKTDEGTLRILLRFLFRGKSWRKYLSHPLISEFHVFVSRYSGLAVYFTMLLAAVVNPSQLTAVYPLVLFLYLILEQPRPPKQVWQFLMYYVCVIITGKYVVRRAARCGPNFFLPQENASGPCELGAGVFFDILVFLSLLWHRTVLYYRGLWDLQSSAEDMLLTNKIHGKPMNTDPEMKLAELPPADDGNILLLTPQSPTFFLSEVSPKRKSLDIISADQQCSDVGEVLKRARASIGSLVNEVQTESFPSSYSNPNAKKPRLPPIDLSGIKRSRTLAVPSTLQTAPAYHSVTPRSTIGTIRPDAGSGDMRRFASLRLTGLMTAQELQPEEDRNMTESQTRVQKSLEEWKVIPSKNLSLFRSSGNGGFSGGIVSHFAKLTKEHEHKAVGDYYILIFLVDFISFVFVTFGFSSIFNSGSGTKPWWTVNFIEIKHLLTLIALFCALVMDRVVYLTRSMKGKLILQYLSVILYHVVIFYMQTNIRTSFTTKAFYMLRCVYFLLSGLQIRNGFPTYTTAQFLLRNYNTPGIILFEIYNFIPFIWLMRTLLDWAVVPTSLEIFQYFRFVDIYLWLYRNRAVNTSRGCFQRRLGQQRRWLPRVYQGFGIFLLCAIALFAPFLFFSVLNPFKVNRNPNQASLSVDLSVPTRNAVVGNNVQTAYNIYSRKTFISGSLQEEDELNSTDLGTKLNKKAGRLTFLADFGTISDTEWNLPNRAKIELLRSLRESVSLPSLQYELSAKTDRQEFKMTTPVNLSRSDVEQITISLAEEKNLSLKVNTTLPVNVILDSASTRFRANGATTKRTVCIQHIYSTSATSTGNRESFWSLQSCPFANCTCTASELGFGKYRNKFVLEFAIVSALQVNGSTILTLYGVILFTLANFMRGFFADKRLIIPYIDMPYTLHLYQLVLDIVYARQDNELEMEEILYNGLTDIYRDQHVMAKWSGERALKIPTEWWIGSENEEAYYCYPSFSETNTEPYMTRIVE